MLRTAAPRARRLPVHLSSSFDSGGGAVDSAPREVAGGVWEASVRLSPEPYTEIDKRRHLQWFHFRASNVSGRTLRITVPNAGEASYANGWRNYHTAASYDRERWFRCRDTTYDGGVLRWELRVPAGRDAVWFAYWAPYSYERHARLVAWCAASPLCRVDVVGSTLDGRPIDVVVVGDGPRQLWVTARQHPGESMAEFAAEGLLRRLADPDDALSRRLRAAATIRVVPNMNPDGSVRGHLRTNACGANLNREWAPTGGYDSPTPERSPEVLHVLREMDITGCDAFVDIHGDEAIEANFLVSAGDVPNWSPRLAALHDRLGRALRAANPDFQLELGYQRPEPADAFVPLVPGKAVLCKANKQIAARFDCLSVTLEMPFKDATHPNPEPECEWAPPRAHRLGASLVDALADAVPHLRPSPAEPRL